jgi:hypothetical protein
MKLQKITLVNETLTKKIIILIDILGPAVFYAGVVVLFSNKKYIY